MADLVDSVLSWLNTKLPFKFVYASEYWMVDMGPHIFPVKKYRMLYEKVIALGAGQRTLSNPNQFRTMISCWFILRTMSIESVQGL